MKEHKDDSLSRRQFLLASALAGSGLMLPTFAAAQSSTQDADGLNDRNASDQDRTS